MKHSVMTRFLAMLLAVVMVAGIVPMAVFATEGNTENEVVAQSDTEFVSETHTVFSRTSSTIAPGVTQDICYAYAKTDGKQMVYYVATADLTRDDVVVQTSYKDQYVNQEFGMEKLTAQIAFADSLYTDETSDRFISEYYKVVAGVNASFYNMTTGQPTGVTYLDGVQIGESSSYAQFFAVLKDGTPIIDYTKNLSNYEGNIDQAVAGSQLLVWEGKDVTASVTGSYNTDRHSRTCVGVTADGKVVVMSLDGRQEPFSCGGTMHELAQIMLEAGCVAAINLDGGGSTTFAARQEGENDVTIVNRPSDGSERSISSGLIIASLAAPSNVFDRATLDAEHQYVTPGSAVAVTAKGVSPAGTAAEIPENVTWQVADSALGTVENGVFVSSGVAGDAEVQMVYEGNVVGSTVIHVVVPEAISFDSSSITVPYGKTVTLSMTATYGLNEVVLKDGDVAFTLADETVGTVSGFAFTAAEGAEADSSAITAVLVFDESITAAAEIKLGKGSEVIYDFEDGTTGGLVFSEPEGTKYNYVWPESEEYIVTADKGKVHSGNMALAAHVNYSNSQESGYQKTSLVGGEELIFDNATRVGMWIYIPDEAVGLWARWTIQGATAKAEDGTYTWTGITGQNMDTTAGGTGVVSQFQESGWHYLSIDTSAYMAVRLHTGAIMQFYISDRDGSAYGYDASDFSNITGDFTFYIDDITIDYSEAVDDREAPVFSSVVYADEFTNDAPELNGQTTTSNTLSFTATVADFVKSNASGLNASTAKAYIDGMEVPFTFSNGKLVIEDAVLADGLHTVKFSICDNLGNYGYVIRQINVNADSGMATVKLVPHDASLDRILHGSVYYMDLVVSCVENVQSVTTTIDLDSLSTWELDHMDVTDGFEASYTIQEDENIATIIITRTGDVEASGEAALVSIPVRIWQLKTGYVYPNGTKEGSQAFTAKQFRDMKEFWRISLIATVDCGVMTAVDGTVTTFTGERVFVDTESWAEDADMIDDAEGLAYYNGWNGGHGHTVETVEDKASTCSEDGYTGRTFCAVCNSVVEWGTTVPAGGHTYEVVDGVLKCACGQLFSGVHTDGKTYRDGVVLEGWDGDSYYVDGVKLTGIQKADGFYYDFGNDGVCPGRVKYTGLFSDGTGTYYALFGELATGWRMLTDGWYYFDPATGAGLVGEHTIDVKGVAVTYNFESTGKLTSDVWYTNASGDMYRYYGPGYYARVWKEIDGETYFLNWVGVAARGVFGVQDSPHMPELFYLFDLDTCALIGIVDGFMAYGGNTYYYHTRGANAPAYGFWKIGDYYYYFSTSTGAMRTGDYTVMSYTSNGLLTENRTFHFDETHGYAVDENGTPLTSLETQEPDSGYPKFVEKNGKTYYYRTANGLAFGFWQIDGYYYYFSTSTGEMRTGDYTVLTYASNGLLKENRTFHFDETHGYAVDENGDPLTTLDKQEPEEEYPKFVEKNGKTYYYRTANGLAFGLWQIDGYYYYFSTSTGEMRTGDYTVLSYTSNGLLTENRTFHFDETHGYAVDENGQPLTNLDKQEPDSGYPKFVEKNGKTYYYRNANALAFGFWEIDGYYYYFSTSTGEMRTGDYTVLSYTSNGLLDKHTKFHFDETYGYAVDENGDPLTSLD